MNKFIPGTTDHLAVQQIQAQSQVANMAQFVDELVREIRRLLIEAASAVEPMGAVNWGDLNVTDVELRRSLFRPEEPQQIVVLIEEADAGCHLANWIMERLSTTMFASVIVECDW